MGGLFSKSCSLVLFSALLFAPFKSYLQPFKPDSCSIMLNAHIDVTRKEAFCLFMYIQNVLMTQNIGSVLQIAPYSLG